MCELGTPLPEIIMGVGWVQETHSTTAAAVSMISALLPTDTGCGIMPEGLLLLLVSRVQLFATLWTVARQALLSMEFSRQEYWSG